MNPFMIICLVMQSSKIFYTEKLYVKLYSHPINHKQVEKDLQILLWTQNSLGDKRGWEKNLMKKMPVFSDHMGVIVLYLDCLLARYLSVNCLKPEKKINAPFLWYYINYLCAHLKTDKSH